MQSKLTALALGIAVVAVGVAGYALMENRALRAELESNHVLTPVGEGGTVVADAEVLERLEAVEADVARVEKVATTNVIPGLGALEGRDTGTPDANAPAPADPLASPEVTTKMKDLVDEAVEEKANQLSKMANKKPSLEVFAEVLELDDEQRALVEREVVRGQRAIRNLLEVPADDGTVFLDELVETLAIGMAKPKEAQPRMMKLFGRLMTEKVPGTDETYAARAEAVKSSVRDAFRESFSENQYARFEAWQMDPTEVQEVEGSAWGDLKDRIVERAKVLGADIPDGDDAR